MQHGFIKTSENTGFYIEKGANTPYTKDGYVHYGYLVELCKRDEDGTFLAHGYAVARNEAEITAFMKEPERYMHKYSSPKYIG